MTRQRYPFVPDRLRRSFGARLILVAFCLSVGALGTTGALAFYLLARTQESERWALQAAISISRLEELHRTLVETESSGRAFLLTGDDRFRAAFHKKLAERDRLLDAYKALAANRGTLPALVPNLEKLIGQRFGYLEARVRGRTDADPDWLRDLAPVQQMEAIAAIIDALTASEQKLMASRTEARRRDNYYLKIALAATVVLGTLTLAALFLHMARLSAERRQAEARATHLAQHDSLTGLPNRRLLAERAALTLAQAARRHELAAVLCMDLDGFKAVNDRHGHEVGDELLRAVAQRLAGLVRAADTAARIGGDEFVVALAQVGAPDFSELVAAKIIESISAPYTVHGKDVRIGASIGIALYPRHGSTLEQLIRHADRALYSAKRAGKLRFELAPDVRES